MLARMVESIAHRGPDDSGVHVSDDGRVGLGNCRLSIQDLSPAGHMPMANEDGRVRATFNGEIYNFQSLRPQLERRGHQFRSHSDTEVLVHLYEERGPAFLQDLDGMFALALWDEDRRTLLLARDRLGEKPLYFTERGGVFRFASEVKAILQDPDVPRVVDLEALNQYLTFGFVLPPRTMFAGISKLAPGERLVVHEHGARESSRVWDPFGDPAEVRRIRALPFDEHARGVRAQLEASVASCMVADVPVGAFLSGGVDSSAVVAMMSRRQGRPVESVTVSYPDDACDESAYAREAARETGARISLVTVGPGDAEQCFAECVYHLDEPIADPACVNTFVASRHLRAAGVPVALVGEGADELFLGYRSYLRYRRIHPLWAFSRHVPARLMGALVSATTPLFGRAGQEARRDLLRRASEGEGLFVSTDPSFVDSAKARLAGTRLANLVRDERSSDATATMQVASHDLLQGDVLAQISAAETRMRLPEQLLMRVDKLSMAHSVEIRAPFLNWRLAQYALGIPGDVRAAGANPKALLKAAIGDLLPARALTRPKMGFGTAVQQWCRTWAGSRLESLVASSQLFSGELLSRSEALRLVREHRSGAGVHHTKIWNLLCLAEWAARYGVSAPAFAESDAPCRR